MKRITVIIERGSDGIYTAVPQHNYGVGFFGSGETTEEALEDLKLSYNEVKELLPELPEFIFEHKYDVASFLQLFSKKLSLTGLQTITGINRKQLNHYVTGHRRPSKATVKKISEGLKKFKEELNQVSFV